MTHWHFPAYSNGVSAIGRTIFTCLAGIAFSAALSGPSTISSAARSGNDFTMLYTGGRLAFSPDLYQPESFVKAEVDATGWSSPVLIFVRQPWEAALLAPLADLPYPAAHAVWFAICVVSLFLFTRCWPSIPLAHRAGAVAWSLPVAMSLAAGQDVPLLLLALGGGFLLLERGQLALAGLCLSLCVMKPHLFWPLAVVFVLGRTWKVCIGGLVGLVPLLGASFLTGGTGWVGGYIGILKYAAHVDDLWKLPLMPTFPAALHGMSAVTTVETCLIAGTVAAIFYLKDWKSAAAIAIVMGIVTARHAFLADCSLVLVSLFLVWENKRQRWALLVATSPLAALPAILGYAGGTALALLCGGACVLLLALPSPLDHANEPEPALSLAN